MQNTPSDTQFGCSIFESRAEPWLNKDGGAILNFDGFSSIIIGLG